ncbi:contractile injection system protein, VgrG/Pvc8 family [Paenibacillus thiaminolyticus]|uniref:contractile injection system protein, VgrG/Pvc8 family n=1 Tax=Paenibacillus TaxID=44249 RepID=UPI001059B7AC|nr:contractile injection system protein, VgrG/Pvc8 family [Paenibacillus dendritiformis]TDL51613.1 hypothetical protein E2R60_18455 [Paenibacillus dendritiformis]
MSRSTKLAGYGNIQIVSSYEIHTLSTLRIEKKVNEHARMLLTAIVPEEKKDSCVDMANDTDTIEIRELSDEGDVIRTLFHGVLSDIAVKVVRGVYHLEMEAVSHSYRLDVKPKTRSFQNHKMLYEELVQHILSDYPGSDFIDLTFNNEPLDQFTVQYEETDWQFLKRMVSRFGTVLIPETAADSPKLWVGLPEGRPDSLRNTNYQVLRTLNNYWQKEEGVTSYSIVTKRYYSLGDRILFKNKPLIVTGSTSFLNEGMPTHEYILQAEADSRWQPIWNESIRGASLAGKVIDAAKDKVKLHLNIDDVQTKEDAYWFPYSSPYVAEGKTGLYCMPQIGDTVQLYIPNHREEEAFVRSSFREGGNSPKLSNPDVKYWGNPFGKELKFNGNELRMTAQENHVFMKLHDNEGIELHSKDAIVVHSDREIVLDAGRLDIRGKEAVYLLSGSSSIVLDGDTDVKGGHVTVKGLTKSPVRVEQPDSPAGKGSARNGKPLKSSTELALHALALIPGIGNAAALGAKTIAATGGSTSHLPRNKTGKSNSVADYSKAAISMMGSIPSPLPATKTITINNPKDASELITMTKAMQLSKVFTSARGLPNQLLAEDVVEKLKLSMKLWAITEQGKEKPPREPLPKYMNEVVKDVGYEKAYQIYKVIQEKGEGVNREDAKKLGISYDGLSLLALSQKLSKNGTSLYEMDMEFREANSGGSGAMNSRGPVKGIAKSPAGLSLKNRLSPPVSSFLKQKIDATKLKNGVQGLKESLDRMRMNGNTGPRLAPAGPNVTAKRGNKAQKAPELNELQKNFWKNYKQSNTGGASSGKGTGNLSESISSTALKQINKKWGKKGIEAFKKAANKGIVGAQGQNGIKVLKGEGVKIGGKTYTHEIKVLNKEYGDYRVFGYIDEAGKLVFDQFRKGLH